MLAWHLHLCIVLILCMLSLSFIPQIAQLLTVRRQQEIEQGISKRESRSLERCACIMPASLHLVLGQDDAQEACCVSLMLAWHRPQSLIGCW